MFKRILNKNSELKENKPVKFIEKTYYYVKIAINKYSNAFSNHLYSQHALFTILAMKIYTKRNNVESIFSTIKRKFNGTNHSRSTQLSNKETNSKTQYTTSTDQTQIN